MPKRTLVSYTRHTHKLSRPVTLAVVSDLHDAPYLDIFPMIEGADALLVPGDISNRYRQSATVGVRFLCDAAKRLPTFVSVGNHETRQRAYRALVEDMQQTGAHVLLNRYVRFGELWIGGWYDPSIIHVPDMLPDFAALDGAKVLLCHKPEDYIRHMKGMDIDLVVAGHAHGGQVRLFGRGLYAPGQGLFPKYTRGDVDGRLIISTGVSNPVGMPRFGNPCEVLMITLC